MAQLIEQSKVDANELPLLIARMLGVEDLPFEERLRAFRVSIDAGLDNDALLQCLVELLRDANCDEGAVEEEGVRHAVDGGGRHECRVDVVRLPRT